MNELRAAGESKSRCPCVTVLVYRPNIPSLNRLHPSQRTRRKLAAASRWVAEALERRILLTTLQGGGVPGHPVDDTLTFFGEDSTNQPFAPVYETIKLFGNITAEVIGTNIDANNVTTLENIPGQLNGADVNGGFALDPGATPVGTLPNDIQSIAVDPTSGIIYGITLDVGTITVTTGTPPMTMMMTVPYNTVNLVSIDPNTGATTPVPGGMNLEVPLLGAAGLAPSSAMNTNGALVTAVPAMTFVGGTMYLVDKTGAGGGGGAGGGNGEQLISLDPANPQNSVVGSAGNFNGVTGSPSAPGAMTLPPIGVTSPCTAPRGPTSFQVNHRQYQRRLPMGQGTPPVGRPDRGPGPERRWKDIRHHRQCRGPHTSEAVLDQSRALRPPIALTGTDAIDYGPVCHRQRSPATMGCRLAGNLGLTNNPGPP